MKGLVSILLAAGSAAALVGMANAQPSEGGPRAILFEQPNFQGRWITIVEGSPDLSRWGFAARAMSGRFEGDWTVCDAPDLDGQCVSVRGDVADLAQVGLRRVVSLGESTPTYARSDGDHETAGFARPAANTGEDRPSAEDESVAGVRTGGPTEAYVASPPSAPPTTAPVANLAPAAPPHIVPAAAPALGGGKGPASPQELALAGSASANASSAGAAQMIEGEAGHSAVFFSKPTRGGAEITVDAQGPANQFCHEQGLGPALYFDTDGHVLRDVLCRRS